MLTWELFWELIRDGGSIAVMAFFLWGSYKRWWVWGHQVQELAKLQEKRIEDLQEERNEWRTLALSGTALADRAVGLAGSKASGRTSR